MTPAHVRIHLIRQIGRPSALSAYREASDRNSVLGLFASPLEAIERILGLHVARAHEHGRGADALLRAIIGEYQTRPSALWPAMLVLAFSPAIQRLARRIRTDAHDRDELYTLVVDSFLAGARALRRASEVTFIPARLRTEMERRAFAEVKKACAARCLTNNLVTEALDRGRIEPFVAGRSETTPHAADEVLAIEAMTDDLVAGAPEALAALDAHLPSLRRLTQTMRPDLSPEEQERLYQRIKRRRLRLRADGVDAASLPPWWWALTDSKQDERRKQ